MSKRNVLWMFVLILVIGICGCGKKNNSIAAGLLGKDKTSKAIAYFQNGDELMYRKDYEDAESEYLIANFYNYSIFQDSDVIIDADNNYLYYKVPMEDMYGRLYRVDTNSLTKNQENPGELVEENVVRNNLKFAGEGILFQKYENEVWTLYYSCPGENAKQILNGDVVDYFINEEDIYVVEKIDADEHADNLFNLWRYNIKTDECEKIEQNVKSVIRAKNETEVMLYSKRENDGRTLYSIKKNGEIVRYIENVKTYRNESDDETIDILFSRDAGNKKADVYQYDGNTETLLESEVETSHIPINAFGYVKDGQIYVYINKTFLRLSLNIDLENKSSMDIEGILENGNLVVRYDIPHKDLNDPFKYNYAILKVENGTIVSEKLLAANCDGDSGVIIDSSSDDKKIYLYANTYERSSEHQLSIIDAEENLKPIDTDFSQGYIDGVDIYSLKGEESGNMREIIYGTLYGRGRIEKYKNLSTLSMIHFGEDIIEESVLDNQVEQVVFAENGAVFYISKGDLLRVDQGEKVRMLPKVSYVWATRKKLKKIGGKVQDTKIYDGR